jgi:hypothetical protein
VTAVVDLPPGPPGTPPPGDGGGADGGRPAGEPAPTTASWTARHYRLLLLAALAAGLLLRIAVGLTDDAPSTDETAYLRSGQSLIAGDGFERNGKPELHFPPMVPVLLGLADKVFDDPHTGTVVLTVVASAALVLPLSLLARRIGGPTAGVVTAWVAALGPGLSTTVVNRGAGSEAEYLLLVASAVWFVVSAADAEGRARLGRVAAGGLLVGLAYLTRPEGLFFAVPLGLAVLVLAVRGVGRAGWVRAAVPLAAAFGLPLLLCVAPYAAYLHSHTGKVQLSAKTQDASLEAWHAVARADRRERDSILWALDESGLSFANTERTSLPALARSDPGGYAGILRTNVGELVHEVTMPEAGQQLVWLLLPGPAWILVGYGIWRSRRSWGARLVLAAAAMPIATALIFFVQPRYLVVATAFATVFVGVGAAGLARRWRTPAVAALAVLLVLSSAAGFRSSGAGWWHPSDGLDQRRAGEWIAANTEPDARILARSMVVEYYADRPTMAIPYADLDDIIAYARHYGADYIVADWYTVVRLRPQLEPIRDEGFSHPELELVQKQRVEGRTYRIFRIVPPPAGDRPMGPPLGFVGDG